MLKTCFVLARPLMPKIGCDVHSLGLGIEFRLDPVSRVWDTIVGKIRFSMEIDEAFSIWR